MDQPDHKVLGVVKRSDISNAYLRHVHGVLDDSPLPAHF